MFLNKPVCLKSFSIHCSCVLILKSKWTNGLSDWSHWGRKNWRVKSSNEKWTSTCSSTCTWTLKRIVNEWNSCFSCYMFIRNLTINNRVLQKNSVEFESCTLSSAMVIWRKLIYIIYHRTYVLQKLCFISLRNGHVHVNTWFNIYCIFYHILSTFHHNSYSLIG